MARTRNIKPGFFTHEGMAENCALGRLLFLGLTTIADFKGEIEWRPKRIKVQLLPYDDCDIDSLAINLDKSGFVRFYSDGVKTYLKIVNFAKHQNPHKNERDAGSDIPEFSEEMRQVFESKEVKINRDLSGSNLEQDGTDPALSLIPSSLLPSSSNSPPSTHLNTCAATVVAVAPVANVVLAKKPKPEKGITNETWEAYADAYQFRYGQRPIRNQSVNGKLAQLVDRLGREEAPKVAAFFLSSNDQFICKRMHDVGLLLQQCEAFRTQWATGRTMTTTRAQQLDRTSSNFDAAQEAIRMLEARSNT